MDNKGYTLIEAVVWVVITSMIMVTLLSGVSSSIFSIDRAYRYPNEMQQLSILDSSVIKDIEQNCGNVEVGDNYFSIGDIKYEFNDDSLTRECGMDFGTGELDVQYEDYLKIEFSKDFFSLERTYLVDPPGGDFNE